MYNNVLVSVIIPTYNVEKYIKEAIDSIINQTYKNLEIIIVDDCSTDNTFKILKEYEKKDNRIQVYQNKENSKISYTLNHALKYATGKYIARMDGDDISYLDRIEKQVIFMENNHEIGLVGGHEVNIDEAGNIIGKNTKIVDVELLYKTILIASPVAHPTWLVRKEVYDKVGGYHTHSPAQDYDFLLRMHSLGLKFMNIDLNAIKCRVIREGNTSSVAELRRRKAVNYILKCYKERKNSGQDLHTNERLEEYVKANIIISILHKYSQKLLESGTKSLRENNKLFGIFKILTSAIISPYQMQFLIRWVKLKLIIKLNKKDIGKC